MRNNLTLLLGVIVLANGLVSDAEGGIFGRRGGRRCARRAPTKCCQPACGSSARPTAACAAGLTCLLYPIYTFNDGMGNTETMYCARKCYETMMTYASDPSATVCAGGACQGCVDPCPAAPACKQVYGPDPQRCDTGLIAYAAVNGTPLTEPESGPFFTHIDVNQSRHQFIWWQFRHEGRLLRLGFEIDPAATVATTEAANPKPKGAFCYTFRANVGGPRVNVILKGN